MKPNKTKELPSIIFKHTKIKDMKPNKTKEELVEFKWNELKALIKLNVDNALKDFAEKIKEEIIINKYISSGCQEEVFISIDKILNEEMK